MAAVFPHWQPLYSEKGIVTFPVRNKQPLVRGYLKLGLQASATLAQKFSEADSFGFALGARSGIAVLDVDSPDERVLADALGRFGETPIIVRSASGNHHAWYRHSGERRRIRLVAGAPIDILGAGFVVAPPSQIANRAYQFIAGSLDDADCLPMMKWLPIEPAAASDSPQWPTLIGRGSRNNALFLHCMKQAPWCTSFYELLDVALAFRNQCLAQYSDDMITDDEVMKTAKSAWRYDQVGENWVGGSFDRATDYIGGEDAFFLIKYLRQQNCQGREFWVANGLAEQLGWSRPRFVAARKKLIDMGRIELIQSPRRGHPATYRFA